MADKSLNSTELVAKIAASTPARARPPSTASSTRSLRRARRVRRPRHEGLHPGLARRRAHVTAPRAPAATRRRARPSRSRPATRSRSRPARSSRPPPSSRRPASSRRSSSDTRPRRSAGVFVVLPPPSRENVGLSGEPNRPDRGPGAPARGRRSRRAPGGARVRRRRGRTAPERPGARRPLRPPGREARGQPRRRRHDRRARPDAVRAEPRAIAKRTGAPAEAEPRTEYTIALDVAAASAAFFAAASALTGFFTFLNVTQTPLSLDRDFGTKLSYFIGSIPVGQAWLDHHARRRRRHRALLRRAQPDRARLRHGDRACLRWCRWRSRATRPERRGPRRRDHRPRPAPRLRRDLARRAAHDRRCCGDRSAATRLPTVLAPLLDARARSASSSSRSRATSSAALRSATWDQLARRTACSCSSRSAALDRARPVRRSCSAGS